MIDNYIHYVFTLEFNHVNFISFYQLKVSEVPAILLYTI